MKQDIIQVRTWILQKERVWLQRPTHVLCFQMLIFDIVSAYPFWSRSLWTMLTLNRQPCFMEIESRICRRAELVKKFNKLLLKNRVHSEEKVLHPLIQTYFVNGFATLFKKPAHPVVRTSRSVNHLVNWLLWSTFDMYCYTNAVKKKCRQWTTCKRYWMTKTLRYFSLWTNENVHAKCCVKYHATLCPTTPNASLDERSESSGITTNGWQGSCHSRECLFWI